MDKIRKKIDKLAKKYKEKKVLIYGAGVYAQMIFENCDLSNLNIVGISDKKFENGGTKNKYKHKAIKPSNIKDLEFDVIFIFIKDVKTIKKWLISQNIIKKFFNKIKIINFDDGLNLKLPCYNVQGEHNIIEIVDKNGNKKLLSPYDEIDGLSIVINGNNNHITISETNTFNNSSLFVQNDNNEITILNNNIISDFCIAIKYGDGQTCEIGENNWFWGGRICMQDTSHLKIGNDCIFATELNIWPADAHSILDFEMDEILNKSTDTSVIIGNHCWCGSRVSLTKNAQIPDNTIIGMCSVVTKKFTQEYTAIAGNPAKIIKENVKWNRLNSYYLEKQRAQEKVK